MAEKSSNRPSNVSVKPVPMKLFAAWEVDKTTPNCIPRQCTFTLTRLVLIKPVGGDVTSVIVAVKMQSSKRTLRSNDIPVPNSGLLDSELDLTFSLQYPHYLKGGGNKLHVILQRRKRYKNRAMLGYKTIATGVINMSEVLQRPLGRDLELMSEEKEKVDAIGRIRVEALSSQPVEQEDPDRQKHPHFANADAERSADYTDDEDDSSSNDEGSDSEAVVEDGAGHTNGALRRRRSSQMRKRNIKQKFIALLKKFRVQGAEAFDTEHYPEELEQELMHKNPREIEDLLFDELDDLSDSGPEADDISISSTPKPSLRPFFSTSTLVPLETEKSHSEKHSDDSLRKGESDSAQDTGTEQEYYDTPASTGSPPKMTPEERKSSSDKETKEKKSKLFARERHTSTSKEKRAPSQKEQREKGSIDKSTSLKDTESSPRKSVVDQLACIFPTDESIPERIVLVDAGGHPGGHGVALALQAATQQSWVVTAGTGPDLRASVSTLVNKIQKFCNCNSKPPPVIRVGVVGPDSFVTSVLRLYVEHFSSKPPEWQHYVRFFIIPLGTSAIARYLASVDNCYTAQFVEPSWKELVDHTSDDSTSLESQELMDRVVNYLSSANAVLQLPVAEVMATYKEKSSDEESLQVFIPFISDVKIGMMEGTATSVDYEDGSVALSGSPPSTSLMEKARENTTPPNSPCISNTIINSGGGNCAPPVPTPTTPQPTESMDLQLDYWTLPLRMEQGKRGESNKFTLKQAFRSLQVSRLPSIGETLGASLTLSYVIKEKKQKIMRLGKKKERETDKESRCQVVEGVHRLICSCKNVQAPLKVAVDGVDWNGVKFFQLTSQWQTHIKYFPVGLYIVPEHGPGH
ncbi:phosphofurin acidic cluster sorting protein 2-like [Ornithodoros turicata]|uniref:phosphofurin acidic cluster sorting protein 2-like n=1 Tax=Ornithodoros turicata TaxID=34597 RepID=UPI003139D72A